MDSYMGPDLGKPSVLDRSAFRAMRVFVKVEILLFSCRGDLSSNCYYEGAMKTTSTMSVLIHLVHASAI